MEVLLTADLDVQDSNFRLISTLFQLPKFCYRKNWVSTFLCKRVILTQLEAEFSSWHHCIEPFIIIFPPSECDLTLKMQRKPASENVLCLCHLLNILAVFQTYFCIQANSVDPDQTAPKGAVWSGSTLFAEMTFKITSRWQSRRQLLWLAV